MVREKELVNIVFLGYSGSGKSTVAGRFLHECMYQTEALNVYEQKAKEMGKSPDVK